MPSQATVEQSIWILNLSENALYGGFFVLYVVSTMLLAQRKKHLKSTGVGFDGDAERLQTMRFWEMTGVLMFIVVTAHWLSNWVIYISDITAPVARKIVFAKMLMSEIMLVLGDIIIIHRLWVVGNKNKLLIAFPLLSFLSFFAFAILLAWQYFLIYWGKHVPSMLARPSWLIGVVASTLSVNLYCTLMMSWKIWWVNRGARRYGGGQLMHIVVILIESTAIYSLWMVTVLALVVIEHSLYTTFYDIATELYGLSTMLISVRVGLGWTTGSGARTTRSERISTWQPAELPVRNKSEGGAV